MSNGVFSGGVERCDPLRLTATTLTTVYTGVDNTAVVAGFSLANETGSAVQMKCYFYDGAADFLVFSRSVPANDTVIVENLPVRLYSGDLFKAQAATGNAITVTPFILKTIPSEAL